MTRHAPDAIIGSYRLAGFLGAGGMGEVYRAVHLPTGGIVALKLFSPAIEARWLARFYHEARVHGSLDHPHIVRLHELVAYEGRPCLAMEYVDGESLAERIARVGRIDPRTALGWFRDLARALAHVHARGIVHRDLKPGNVRLTRDDQVKLLDFGIAKSADAPAVTHTGHVIGTLGYLAPEQLAGGPVSPATDIWALGILLYEMVTGAMPFDGATPGEVWARIASGSFVRAGRLVQAPAAGAPPLLAGIDRLLDACLAVDRAKRATSAFALAEQADGLVAATPPGAPARPDGRGRALRAAAGAALAWLERSWLALAALAAAVVLGVLVAAAIGARGPARSTAPGGGDTIHRIDVLSGRARVFVNGREMGTTPFAYPGRAGETIEIELRQEGFEPVKGRISITTDATSTFEMKAAGRLP